MRFWRNRRRGGLLTLVVSMVSLAIIAAACSSSEPEPTAPAAPSAPSAPSAAPTTAPSEPAPVTPAGQPGAGQTLNVLITNLGNGLFDTWLSDGEDLKYLKIFDAPLVGGEGGSSIIGGTISDWEMDGDGLGWTFTAVDGDWAKFHDGSQITVEDTQWSVDKMLGNLADELLAGGYYEPRDVADAVQYEDVTLVAGTNTFTLESNIPRPDTAFWMSENAQGPQGLIQPKAYTLAQVEAGDKGYEGYERAPIGSGPYMITDWVAEQKYQFERFTDYWWTPENGFAEDRRGKFEFLNMEVVSEDATRTAALQSGNADLIEANVLMQDQIKSNGGTIAWQNESAYNWMIYVDCWSPDMWCFDSRVRRAGEMAIDRETIVNQLYGQGATAKGWSFVTPNAMGYSTDLDPLPFDVAGAKALLAEAGMADADVSFEIHTWEAGDTPLLPELAQLAADAWNENLGWDVTVVVGDASAVRQRWNNRELPGSVLIRTNEARFDGTSIASGSYNNSSIAWRMIDDPDIEPWKSTTTPVIRKALEDLNPATRDASFNEMYKFMKNENHQWSAFYTNLPWGVGPAIKTGSYQPWELVPYVTAIWTAEPAN